VASEIAVPEAVALETAVPETTIRDTTPQVLPSQDMIAPTATQSATEPPDTTPLDTTAQDATAPNAPTSDRTAPDAIVSESATTPIDASVLESFRPVPVRRTRGALPPDAALARAVRARPQLTSAALALASVSRFGESAREQAEWLRRSYPKVGPERLSRVALDSARKRARYAVGAALFGGPFGIAAGVSTVGVAKARLIIDIAAIFGADPLAPDRAVDVLVLLGAYADAPAAAKAVAELIGDADVAGDVRLPRPTIVGAATAQLLTRAAGRLIPGFGALAQALRTETETEQLTERTIRHYRG
jgi:hypothetical protein